MVVVSILPQAEFGPNDHREDAPHVTYVSKVFANSISSISEFGGPEDPSG